MDNRRLGEIDVRAADQPVAELAAAIVRELRQATTGLVNVTLVGDDRVAVEVQR